MANQSVTRLKTALQVTLAALREQDKAAWASRLDPAAYHCRRFGSGWLAEGPCGIVLQMKRNPDNSIACVSDSGHEYRIEVAGNGMRCGCPARAKADTCKHEVGVRACLATHRRIMVSAPAVVAESATERLAA